MVILIEINDENGRSTLLTNIWGRKDKKQIFGLSEIIFILKNSSKELLLDYVLAFKN